MSRITDAVFSGILAASALAIAVSVVHRSFFGPAPNKPTYVQEWETGLENGVLLGGDEAAPVHVVVLSDLECPACAAFHPKMTAVMRDLGETAKFTYMSYPLDYHEFAAPAARIAECAAASGRIGEWMDAVFAGQDSLGKVPWIRYASAAGFDDSAASAIADCAERPNESFPRIAGGLEYGKRVGLTGTPTVLINGWRLPGTPSEDSLRAVILRIAEGKKPR